MQVIEFSPNHRRRACFSSRNNNFARQLPAALVAVYPVAVISFGKSHVRDIQVSLKPPNVKRWGREGGGGGGTCVNASDIIPQSVEKCAKLKTDKLGRSPNALK